MQNITIKLAALKREIANIGLPALMKRSWCPVTDPPERDDRTIRVMQWNVLAQALSQGENNFVLCPEKALSWEVRKLRMIEEILSYSADIICLEEVDMFSFISSELRQVGYEGLFCPKHNSPCLKVENNAGPDGCALFYHTDRLTLIKSENLNFYIPPENIPCNQVGLLASFHLQPSQSGPIHVLATHLKAKSGFEELRMKQTKFLTDLIWEKLGSEPLIFCGDFNGNPSEPFYKVLENSLLGLQSAYKGVLQDNQEPPYTTWKIRGGLVGVDKTTASDEEHRESGISCEEPSRDDLRWEEQNTSDLSKKEPSTDILDRKEKSAGDPRHFQSAASTDYESSSAKKSKTEQQSKGEVKASEEKGTKNEEKIGDSQEKTANSEEKTAHCEQRTSNIEEKATNSKEETANYEEKTTNSEKTTKCKAESLKESCSTIDYIWISKSWFTVNSVLGLPTDEDIGPNRLPSLTYPSDHLSLVCDLTVHAQTTLDSKTSTN